MPLKVGNILQAKVGTALANLTTTLFTLPAQAQIVAVSGFGTITGTILFSARPINSTVVTQFGSLDATQAAAGQDGNLTGVIPYQRQSVPMVISVTGNTAGDCPVRVTYM